MRLSVHGAPDSGGWVLGNHFVEAQSLVGQGVILVHVGSDSVLELASGDCDLLLQGLFPPSDLELVRILVQPDFHDFGRRFPADSVSRLSRYCFKPKVQTMAAIAVIPIVA